MGLFKHLSEAIFMTIIGYSAVFALTIFGINFGPWMFTKVGVLVIFTLATMYTLYFRL